MREVGKANVRRFALQLQVKRLKERLSAKIKRGRGRPSASYHQEWIETFKRIREDMIGDDAFGLVDDEKRNNIELSQLVVDKLGLNVTARAVWLAVRPFV